MNAPPLQSPNFGFLREHGEHLLEFAARAERYVLEDPNTCLIKLRQLAEEMAELAAAHTGIRQGYEDGFSDLLRKLRKKDIITREMADIFHGLRKAGNAAAHEGAGSRQEAVSQLKLARELAVWFHRAFREPGYRPGPFVLPPNPRKAPADLKAELGRLRKARWDMERRADDTEDALREALRAHEAAEKRAESMYVELEAALALAEETESREATLIARHRARVAELQADLASADSMEQDVRKQQAREAASRFDLSEGEARELIDAQLRASGWEADSVVRTWENGARPQVGRNQAIAFYPAGNGYADYLLVCGTTPVAIVEAKRRNHDLVRALSEAEAHVRAFSSSGGGASEIRRVYASNGRPFANEADRKHGIWYREVGQRDKTAQALRSWPSPDELA